MSFDWIDTTIGEQATLQRGFDITKLAQRNGIVPVISSGGINSFHDTAMAIGPGVILGRKGVVGSVYYIEGDYWPHDTTLWVKDFHGNDPHYIYYFFTGFSKQLSALDVGSANPTLNRNHVHPIKITWPNFSEQRKISKFLGTLDDRIALLRETNVTLEAIAQALFKSWFVDFDPVRSKQEGRDPEGMDNATAGLFPDSFEESELGLVPRGWKWVNLDAIALVTMGLSPKGDSYNFDGIGIPLINGPVEFGEYFPVQTKWTNMASKFANEGDLIFCVRGSTTGRRVVSDREYCIGRGVCAIRGNNDSANFICQTINFGIDRLLNKTTGSVFPSLSGPDIKTFKVLNPTEVLINAYENTTKSILLRIKENHRQAKTLATLRDTLLPRLISGQLRLPEAASLLEKIAA